MQYNSAEFSGINTSRLFSGKAFFFLSSISLPFPPLKWVSSCMTPWVIGWIFFWLLCILCDTPYDPPYDPPPFMTPPGSGRQKGAYKGKGRGREGSCQTWLPKKYRFPLFSSAALHRITCLARIPRREPRCGEAKYRSFDSWRGALPEQFYIQANHCPSLASTVSNLAVGMIFKWISACFSLSGQAIFDIIISIILTDCKLWSTNVDFHVWVPR